MTDTAIRLTNVSKRFPGTDSDAVSGLNLEIPSGSIVTLIGPSGCGKTTTLRMINRLIEPTSGRLEINGADVTSVPVTELRRGIGYVIQQVGLFPHRTVAQNIAMLPKLLGWEQARIADRVAELTELVGLDASLADRYPDELSGGQQQRVGVARALAADPPVLLMDEPFGAVDPIVRGRLQDELLALQQKVHKTIVLVTHDIDEALKIADRVALFNIGAVVEQFSSPDELLRAPQSEFVEQFIGEDRGMKRLALKYVSQLPFDQGTVVDARCAVPDAVAALDNAGVDWLGVTRDGQFEGWLHRDDLIPGADLDAGPLRRPAAQVTPASTLRNALELIMTSQTAAAVIVDGDRFAGVVTLEAIRKCLSSDQDQ